MKRTKIGLAALAVLVGASATVAFKPAAKQHARFTSLVFDYIGPVGNAADMDIATNWTVSSASCTNGTLLCAITAVATSGLTHPVLPVGIGTKINSVLSSIPEGGQANRQNYSNGGKSAELDFQF